MLKTLFILSLIAFISVQAYDEKLAYELLRASTASYCAQQHLQSMKCGDACNNLKGYNFHHQFLRSFTSAESVSYSLFVNHNTKRVVAAFRGTQGFNQLTQEILQSKAVTYTLHPIKNCVVTQYFFEKYRNTLRGDFLKAFLAMASQYKSKGYTFLFTGHSLGGAFATHAALDMVLSNIVPKNQVILYTFGSPRVGDYNFASAVSNSIKNFRVTNKHDLVPHFPPCLPNLLKGGCAQWPNHPNQNGWIAYNAYHVWPEVFYNGKGYKVCSNPEDLSCANQYKVPFLYISDHLEYLGLNTACLATSAIKK